MYLKTISKGFHTKPLPNPRSLPRALKNVTTKFEQNRGDFERSLKLHQTSLRQDPFEVVLAIFGHRALIFFWFESSWKKMKNDTTFVHIRSGDHLGDAKKCQKGHLTPSNFTFFIDCDRHKRFLQNERGRVDLQKLALEFFFLSRDLVMILKNLFVLKRIYRIFGCSFSIKFVRIVCFISNIRNATRCACTTLAARGQSRSCRCTRCSVRAPHAWAANLQLAHGRGRGPGRSMIHPKQIKLCLLDGSSSPQNTNVLSIFEKLQRTPVSEDGWGECRSASV